MLLDSSAIIALLLCEPRADALLEVISEAPVVAVAAPTLVESGIVLTSKGGPMTYDRLAKFLRDSEAEIIPFTADHAAEAVEAFKRYGKGRHPAALNFGDCICYAVARLSGMPLLFTGHDFSKTDIRAALQP